MIFLDISPRVHHAGARGTRSPKVFKLTTVALEPGRQSGVTRRHACREATVRRLYPGPHRIDIQINRRVIAAAEVVLMPAETSG